MRKRLAAELLLFSFLSIAASMKAQQPPEKDRAGNPVFIVRSDSTAAATIEYRSNNQWQQIVLEPGMDAPLKSDRVRVATTREDKAIVTVDLPIQAGKKYRLFWNARSSIWDFSPAS
jgi:hypothetical protein